MKIAIVTSTFPPYTGGIGNVAAANARELVKLGHQVTVFTPAYQKTSDTPSDIKIVRLPIFLAYGNAAFVPALDRQLKGFDIIHLHYPFFGGAEVVWWNNKKYKKQGTKIVLHYHMDVVGQGIFKLIFAYHKKIILPRIIKMADKIIVTSNDYAKQSDIAKYLQRQPNKFVEIFNGVAADNFKSAPKDQNLLIKYNINLADRVILFVGGLDKAHYFKGVANLLEAMSRLGQVPYNWKLIIVGDGDLKKDYIGLAEKLKIDSRTIFVGKVSHDDLVKHYNLADVVVLPSVDKSEAFGLVLVEAMACAKAVIASDLPGVRSVVDQDKNGVLVRLKDIDDLATKINKLLVNPELTTQFGLAGRIKVESFYDWPLLGQKINKLYEDLFS